MELVWDGGILQCQPSHLDLAKAKVPLEHRAYCLCSEAPRLFLLTWTIISAWKLLNTNLKHTYLHIYNFREL
jgi:hypothetical protein